MREHADVVVIGGGITGCSIAYHLAEAGCSNVVLLEKGALTSGTTFHSVGLVTQFRSTSCLVETVRDSIQLYERLKAEKPRLGWHPVGSIRIASSKERWHQFQARQTDVEALGVAVESLTPEAAQQLYPYLNADQVEGALYLPADGYANAVDLTFELAWRAQQRGVSLAMDTLVTAIDCDHNRHVQRVHTDQGVIRTNCVVNAAGMWAPRIAEMVGVQLPIIPMVHQHIITESLADCPLSPQTPVLRDPDNLCYIREEKGGFLVGGFGQHAFTWAETGVPWTFNRQLLPYNPLLNDEVMDGAIKRVPCLAHASIGTTVTGPGAVTPDGLYLLGPVHQRSGFFVAAGMSFNGIAGAGGVGKLMAEWILEGYPSRDVGAFDVNRFDTEGYDAARASDQARAVYTQYYQMPRSAAA